MIKIMQNVSLPPFKRFVIVGAGIHGLSTAWNLARDLRCSAKGSGADILVLDKSHVGAGASGIACGVVRNNYWQPAMRELMSHCVDMWESDVEAFSYHPVGYMQISHEAMRADVASIHEQQQQIGYPSTFVEGSKPSFEYMRDIFHDWQAQNITSVLHENRGGYANNKASLLGLYNKAVAEDVCFCTGVTVKGFQRDTAGAIIAVHTDSGTIQCDMVIVAVGPWIPQLWSMLDLPTEVEINLGDRYSKVETWRYMCLQEGTLNVDPGYLVDNEGNLPPVIHVDTDAPLHDDHGLVTDEPWGIYYKPDFNFGGVQGGYMPYEVDKPAKDVAVDPYGPESPDFVVGNGFYRTWTAALAHCQKRFEGKSHLMDREPSGGIGSFSPDNFPIFDTFCENVYIIADSNHGYKMIGVGSLVAQELLGIPSVLLEPFRWSRYAQGSVHPVSNSPYPWS